MAEFKKPKEFKFFEAISSIDGRFRGNIEVCSSYFSEKATIKNRVFLEITYLIQLIKFLEKDHLTTEEINSLKNIYKNFSQDDTIWIIDKDLEINHDTKAVEYFLQEKFKELKLDKYINWIHFGLTSADIDNNGLVLSMKQFEEEIFSNSRSTLLKNLKSLITSTKDSVFLGRTHGKYAVPTIMGKEILNFYARLKKIDEKISLHKFEGKLTGAVGNLNSFKVAYPKLDWIEFSKNFITELGLEPNLNTTQILPYDNIIEHLQLQSLYNSILIAFSKDMWTYISDGYFNIIKKDKEVGSSTMPQKVNPIAFEAAQSYSELSRNTLDFLSNRLAENRLQRDLTDKYLAREIGVAMAQSYLATQILTEGIKNIEFDIQIAQEEADNHWEVLTEAVQTILRSKGYDNAYEKIKNLSRGKTMKKEDYLSLINQIDDIDPEVKESLLSLSPQTYTGFAKELIAKQLN